MLAHSLPQFSSNFNTIIEINIGISAPSIRIGLKGIAVNLAYPSIKNGLLKART